MIIYIHGFGSSGQGNKAKVFRKYFKSIEEDFIAPSLSYIPELAIETLIELIESYHGEIYLIASSLGGFYATYLSKLSKVKKVLLINPATKPIQTLEKSLGKATNFYDNSFYSWNEKHLTMLKNYNCDKIQNIEKFMLMVQKNDELLDYRDAVKKYNGANQIIEEGGNHNFTGIEQYLETIRDFFAVGNHFKHTSQVKGVGFTNKELANRVGNLYYDNMAEFLEALSKKIILDADADRKRGRVKLANLLNNGAIQISNSVISIQTAWKLCEKPTIEWMNKNGINKKLS